MESHRVASFFCFQKLDTTKRPQLMSSCTLSITYVMMPNQQLTLLASQVHGDLQQVDCHIPSEPFKDHPTTPGHQTGLRSYYV